MSLSPRLKQTRAVIARERGLRSYARKFLPPDEVRYVLTPSERRFAEEFIADSNLDARAAAVRAGFEPRDGSRLLAKPQIQDAIALLKSRALSRCEIYGDAILRNWKTLADADPTELQYSYRAACRRCWGVDHLHQFNDVEFAEARAEHLARQLRLRDDNRVPFDEKGGPGYTRNREPMRGPDWLAREILAWPPDVPFHLDANSDHSCPSCSGDGELIVVIRDTRSLSPAGKLLFDGFKQTSGFVEVKMRDRFRAEEYVARFAGLFNDRRQIDDLDPERLTDEQLNAAVARLVERGTVEIEGSFTPSPDRHVTDAVVEDVPIAETDAP